MQFRKWKGSVDVEELINKSVEVNGGISELLMQMEEDGVLLRRHMIWVNHNANFMHTEYKLHFALSWREVSDYAKVKNDLLQYQV